MLNYWVVGASWGGVNHQDKNFVDNGIWMLGREEGSQLKTARQMKSGDRIAIKRMKGKKQKGITIRHIGIIKGIVDDTSNFICTVDWVATDLSRNIEESKGCFQSVHGPFRYDDCEHKNWIEKIFCL